MKTKILSTFIESTDYRQAFKKLLHNNGPDYVTVNNVHTVVEAANNDYYKKIINESYMALPDGRPLSIVAGWKGDKNMQRVCGPSFLEKVLDWGREHNLKHFFWGGTFETLDKMSKVISNRFPGTIIIGMESPPFRNLTEKENNYYLDKMNESESDIFWVGLGAPKQEIWMQDMKKELGKGVMIGVGAAFDYFAGNIQRPPVWLRRSGLEWLCRLYQDPVRLSKRYFITNSLFIFYLLGEVIQNKKAQIKDRPVL